MTKTINLEKWSHITAAALENEVNSTHDAVKALWEGRSRLRVSEVLQQLFLRHPSWSAAEEDAFSSARGYALSSLVLGASIPAKQAYKFILSEFKKYSWVINVLGGFSPVDQGAINNSMAALEALAVRNNEKNYQRLLDTNTKALANRLHDMAYNRLKGLKYNSPQGHRLTMVMHSLTALHSLTMVMHSLTALHSLTNFAINQHINKKLYLLQPYSTKQRSYYFYSIATDLAGIAYAEAHLTNSNNIFKASKAAWAKQRSILTAALAIIDPPPTEEVAQATPYVEREVIDLMENDYSSTHNELLKDLLGEKKQAASLKELKEALDNTKSEKALFSLGPVIYSDHLTATQALTAAKLVAKKLIDDTKAAPSRHPFYTSDAEEALKVIDKLIEADTGLNRRAAKQAAYDVVHGDFSHSINSFLSKFLLKASSPALFSSCEGLKQATRTLLRQHPGLTWKKEILNIIYSVI